MFLKHSRQLGRFLDRGVRLAQNLLSGPFFFRFGTEPRQGSARFFKHFNSYGSVRSHTHRYGSLYISVLVQQYENSAVLPRLTEHAHRARTVLIMRFSHPTLLSSAATQPYRATLHLTLVENITYKYMKAPNSIKMPITK